jgi:hypothetical protein
MRRIGEILRGSMRLLVERPGAVLVWGLAFLAGVAMIVAFQRLVAMPLLATDEPSIVMGLAVEIGRRLLSMLVFALIGTAVFRAVLWREEAAWFSMRIGMDEVRVYALMLVLALLQLAGGFILGLLLAFASSLASFVSAGNETVLDWLGAGLAFAAAGLVIWLGVRLSPALPLAVVRRRISIDGAWDLSRGHFWSLFLGYLLVGLIAAVIAALILAPFFGDLFFNLLASGGDPYMIRYALSNFAYRQMAAPAPILIGEGLAVWFALTLLYVLNIAAVGAATRSLLVGTGEFEEDDLY